MWQGAVIALALAVVLAALRRASPGARYAASAAALLLMALAPIATLGLFLVRPDAPELASAVPPPLPALGATDAGGDRALSLLVCGWLAGVLLMEARLALGLVHLRRNVLSCAIPLPDDWQRRLCSLGESLGVCREVGLFGSDRVEVPIVVGWLRPAIFVPLSVLTELPASYLEAILAHELAHIRRRDYLVNIIQSAVEAALFYHPAVHWVSGRIRHERELCCDDAAVALTGDAIGYARALTELETLRAQSPALSLASTGGSLIMRIRRILDKDAARPSRFGAWVAPALLLSGVLGLSLAGAVACQADAADSAAPPQATTAAAPVEASSSVRIAWLPPVLQRHVPALLQAAARHGVDPDVLAIVMLVESSGNERARSPVGAVGLMQIMPTTAARIAGERGLGDHADERLWDPAYNLDLGGYYFAQQLAAFGADGDPGRSVELAAAAYNSGPRRVREYLDGKATLPAETEHYKALVVGMWNERGQERSPTYEAWRERVRSRVATRTESPLPGGRVTQPFGTTPEPWTGEAHFHEGVDLAAPLGTKVRAPLDGTVKEVGAEGDRGRVVVLDHGNGIETRFHHLGDLGVQPGQAVARGEIVGTVGVTGKVTGPHVHFEVRDNGEPLDPARYLGHRD